LQQHVAVFDMGIVIVSLCARRKDVPSPVRLAKKLGR